jgi:hypothetical protein
MAGNGRRGSQWQITTAMLALFSPAPIAVLF